MIKVLTTGRLAEQFQAHFQDKDLGIEVRLTPHPTQAQIDWADCLASFPIDADVSLTSLAWIHSFGAGVDGFLKRDDLNGQLRLSRTTGRLGAKAGEFCLCHVLNFFQDTFSLYEDKQSRTWRQRSSPSVSAKTVLLLGTGAMAQGIAPFLRACGMQVVGVNTSGTANSLYFDHCLRFDSLPVLDRHVSCVINTLPLYKATERLLDLRFFAHFRQALFINVGRGQSVQTDDLRLALDAEYLRYCVLDVFDTEPLPQSSWLWWHPKVFISPHRAAITEIEDVIPSFLEALQAYSLKRPSKCFVDKYQAY